MKYILEELLLVMELLSVTFHMAFNEIKDKKQAIEELIFLGVNRILTKGGSKSAFNNIKDLKDLVKYAGEKIIILPRGRITKDNYKILAKEYHGSKIIGELV